MLQFIKLWNIFNHWNSKSRNKINSFRIFAASKYYFYRLWSCAYYRASYL